MYIKFKKLSLTNIGGYGPETQSIEFEKGISTINGFNGQGKCVKKSTKIGIKIENEDTKKKFEDFIKQRKAK
jgi:hypothetical protein